MTKKNEPQTIVLPQKYNVVCVDGALDRPGFAVIRMNGKVIEDIALYNSNNKGKDKSHGQKLDDILEFFQNTVVPKNDLQSFYVRQHAVGQKFYNDTAVYEQVGMLNWWLWKNKNLRWIEYYPSTIKKCITGNGRSNKEQVRVALSDYVGKQEYKCDDESDALAIGLTFLISLNQISK